MDRAQCQKQNAAETSAQPISELKTREILRVTYPLNRSGSKQVIVGLDPTLDFTPVITIGRAGWSGFRMSQEAFSVLCSYTSLIQKFFEEESGKYGSILLGAQEVLEFRRSWGRNLIIIASNTDPSEKVTMAKSTFDGFVKVIPLINYVTTKYLSYQSDAMSFFASLCKTVKSHLSPDFLMSAPVVQNTHEFMHVLRDVSIHSVESGTTESTIDIHQLFYELVAYCSEDIAAYIPYV
jgi:hypothetical protein